MLAGWRPAWLGKPLSMDLRLRVLGAVDEGMGCRAAAWRFGVAAATVIRWHDELRRELGQAGVAGDLDAAPLRSPRDYA